MRRLAPLAVHVPRALGRAVPVLLVTAAVTFLLGAFAKQEPAELLLGESATAEAVAALDHELGRDRPLPVQFGLWLRLLALAMAWPRLRLWFRPPAAARFGLAWLTASALASALVLAANGRRLRLGLALASALASALA